MDHKTKLKSPIEDEPWAIEHLDKLRYFLEDKDGKYLREVRKDIDGSESLGS